VLPFFLVFILRQKEKLAAKESEGDAVNAK